MKIVLLRHGNPDFEAHLLTPENGARYELDLYAASRVTTNPPFELSDFRSLFNVCVTSDLARTIDSAQLLGFNDSVATGQFNESDLPHPNNLLIPMPWSLFLVIYRLLWYFGFKQNCPGKIKDQERAFIGSKYLSDLASNNGAVLLVGHGIMNRLLCSQLQKSGWSVDNKSGSGYWSSITMSRQLSGSKSKK